MGAATSLSLERAQDLHFVTRTPGARDPRSEHATPGEGHG